MCGPTGSISDPPGGGPALSNAFDGVWDLRLAERTDLNGKPMELHQVGATISGCVGTVILNGT